MRLLLLLRSLLVLCPTSAGPRGFVALSLAVPIIVVVNDAERLILLGPPLGVGVGGLLLMEVSRPCRRCRAPISSCLLRREGRPASRTRSRHRRTRRCAAPSSCRALLLLVVSARGAPLSKKASVRAAGGDVLLIVIPFCDAHFASAAGRRGAAPFVSVSAFSERLYRRRSHRADALPVSGAEAPEGRGRPRAELRRLCPRVGPNKANAQ